MAPSLLDAAVVVGVVWWLNGLRKSSSSIVKLPPGPPPDPIIEHLRVMPKTRMEHTFYEWAKQYGDVMQLRLLGRSIIVLSSIKTANDLLDKRNNIYSSRPRFLMSELMGWKDILPLLPYGPKFRKARKLIQQNLEPAKSVQYRSIQTYEARKLVSNLFERPAEFDWLLKRFATAVIVRITYGHHIVSDDDKLIKLMNDNSYGRDSAGSPGATPIDLMPILQYVPTWVPILSVGTRHIRDWGDAGPRLQTVPFDELREKMAKGAHERCFTSEQLERLASEGLIDDEEEFREVKMAAATFYTAGADTTWATLMTFIAAMVLHPTIQSKAREEIISLTGGRRLPEFEDRPSLPYVDRLMQEVMRWHPAVFFAGHLVTEDDVYDGLTIPKGSLVLANALSIVLDERVYSNPSAFDPDRYATAPKGSGEPYPTSTWGYGRRICPGRHLADAGVWMTIATLLSTVQILKPLDANGKEFEPEIQWTSGLVSNPEPFQCRVVPLSKEAKELIAQAVA